MEIRKKIEKIYEDSFIEDGVGCLVNEFNPDEFIEKLLALIKQEKEGMIEEIEKIGKLKIDERYFQYKPNLTGTGIEEEAEKVGYNQALDDIIKKLK